MLLLLLASDSYSSLPFAVGESSRCDDGLAWRLETRSFFDALAPRYAPCLPRRQSGAPPPDWWRVLVSIYVFFAAVYLAAKALIALENLQQ